jgi:hypothetical protein
VALSGFEPLELINVITWRVSTIGTTEIQLDSDLHNLIGWSKPIWWNAQCFFSRPAPPHSNFRIHCGLKHPDMTKPTWKSNHPATHGFGWGFSFENGKFRIQCHFPRGFALRQSYPAAGMRMLTLHIWHPVVLRALILIVTGLIAMGLFSKIH